MFLFEAPKIEQKSCLYVVFINFALLRPIPPMKTKFLFLLLMGVFSLTTLANEPLKDLNLAFAKGDIRLMQSCLGEKISLSVVNKKSDVPTEKAITEVNQFLTSLVIESFTIRHTSFKEESGYIIGSLQTSSGRYRVNCFFKKGEEKFFIHQIRIDKANE